jgi:hypothetical protein
MINPQDFDVLVLQAIDRDVGKGRKQELSRSLFASDTAKMRPLFQGVDSCVNLANGSFPVMRMVLFEVIANAL